MREASLARTEDFDYQVHKPGMEKTFLSGKRQQQALENILSRLSGAAKSRSRPEPENRHGSTTHISVVDRGGMAVSLTTSNGEGSGIVVPGTGIHLNNMLGEEDINPMGFHTLPAGKTLSSMMAPSIFMQHGMPRLVLGSGGSNRLRGAILQVLYRHIIKGEGIETAVHAPRLHNEADMLDAEPGRLTAKEHDLLASLGWDIREWKQQSVYFGGVHAISMEANGSLHGAGDPRRGGAIAWA
jgi:gamma-glutamyltranspeptidase/glutathione hydrolase